MSSLFFLLSTVSQICQLYWSISSEGNIVSTLMWENTCSLQKCLFILKKSLLKFWKLVQYGLLLPRWWRRHTFSCFSCCVHVKILGIYKQNKLKKVLKEEGQTRDVRTQGPTQYELLGFSFCLIYIPDLRQKELTTWKYHWAL